MERPADKPQSFLFFFFVCAHLILLKNHRVRETSKKKNSSNPNRRFINGPHVLLFSSPYYNFLCCRCCCFFLYALGKRVISGIVCVFFCLFAVSFFFSHINTNLLVILCACFVGLSHIHARKGDIIFLNLKYGCFIVVFFFNHMLTPHRRHVLPLYLLSIFFFFFKKPCKIFTYDVCLKIEVKKKQVLFSLVEFDFWRCVLPSFTIVFVFVAGLRENVRGIKKNKERNPTEQDNALGNF